VTDTIPVAPGTIDPATAPTLDTPPLNESTVFFDAPDFETTLDRIYRLDIAAAGTYIITMDWNIGDDIDMFLCPTVAFEFDDPDDPTDDADPANCDFSGATGDHPESVAFALTPGDYYIWADDFGQFAGGAPAIGTRLTLIVTQGEGVFPAMISALKMNPSNLGKLRRWSALGRSQE
jgi:hypothetical protein